MKTYMAIMTTLTKCSQDEDRITSYVFDMFSKYKDTISKDQLIQVVQTLGDLPEEEVKQDLHKAQALRKPEFQSLCKKIGLRLHYFAKLSTMFLVELEQKPTKPATQELEAIRLSLDGEVDLREYMQKSLQTASPGDTYFVLNKKFWLAWSSYVGLKDKDAFGSVSSMNNTMQFAACMNPAQKHERTKEKIRRPVGI